MSAMLAVWIGWQGQTKWVQVSFNSNIFFTGCLFRKPRPPEMMVAFWAKVTLAQTNREQGGDRGCPGVGSVWRNDKSLRSLIENFKHSDKQGEGLASCPGTGYDRTGV